jgi:hypothetical protein
MKKPLILFCAILMIAYSNVKAQLVMEVDSSLVYINGEGTFINVGKGEGTKFNFLTAIQPGIQYNRLNSNSTLTNSNRMSLNLVRLSINATTLKNKVSIGILTDFTGDSPLLEGWVGFAMNKNIKLVLGQKQTNTNNRLAMADERYAQVMGQSTAGKSNDGVIYGGLMQNFVGSTREGGMFLETNFSINKMRVYPSFSVTTGEGQNFFSEQTNKGFKYGGRLDILPFGDFIKNNSFIAHDIYREPKPKVALGVAASYNAKASSPIGSDNAIITSIYNKTGTADFANYRKLVADFVFKSNGFALVGEYIVTNVTGKDLYTNKTATNKLTEQEASSYYNLGSGYNLQTSYIFKNGWTIDARYAKITPEFDAPNSKVHKQTWSSFGINKFIKNNAVKVGLNTNFIEDRTTIVTTKKWINNFAVQILL